MQYLVCIATNIFYTIIIGICCVCVLFVPIVLRAKHIIDSFLARKLIHLFVGASFYTVLSGVIMLRDEEEYEGEKTCDCREMKALFRLCSSALPLIVLTVFVIIGLRKSVSNNYNNNNQNNINNSTISNNSMTIINNVLNQARFFLLQSLRIEEIENEKQGEQAKPKYPTYTNKHHSPSLRSDDILDGVFHYGIVSALVTAFLWRSPASTLVFSAMLWGDASAAIFGKLFGRHRFSFWISSTKSIEGLIAFFVMTVISSLCWMFMFGAWDYHAPIATGRSGPVVALYWIPDVGQFITDAIILSLVSCMAEAASPPRVDNLVIGTIALFTVLGLAHVKGSLYLVDGIEWV
eukprot:gb/GECH01005140.1/.p1 GENE.gb/GECH01005140.1/~~gb/GECH01005140.1/.p1  ORF type:complete len:349 (+),score=55.97 gb/GECH01005140.1/:1-1047(+)